MIKNALIDVGNVLLRLRSNPWEGLFRGSIPDEARMTAFRQLYALFESGGLRSEEFISRGMEITNFQGSADEFSFRWCDIFAPIHPMHDFCAWMKERSVRLVLFSNTNPLHEEEIRKSAFYRFFDNAVYSYVVGEMKPGDGMYEYAVSGLRLDPAETLYVDDLAENILTGKVFGFRSYRFDPMRVEQNVEELKSIFGV